MPGTGCSSATRSLMSIHNIAYQGVFAAADVASIGTARCSSTLWIRSNWRPGRISPLREGIRHADHISTVSPTYAREIQTPAIRLWTGWRAAQSRACALTGILNGVDYQEWDPRHDRFLPLHYNASQLGTKADAEAGVPAARRPRDAGAQPRCR